MSSASTPSHGSDRAPALAHARVADVMQAGVVTCPRETALETIARIMRTRRIHAVVVTDAGGPRQIDPRALWGILTEADLLRAVLDESRWVEAGDVASIEVVTVHPDMPLDLAARLMIEQQLDHLLVISPQTGRPIGVVSTLDVVEAISWEES